MHILNTPAAAAATPLKIKRGTERTVPPLIVPLSELRGVAHEGASPKCDGVF